MQLLDPTEFRSLMSLLDIDIDGLIFEDFVWEFHHCNISAPAELHSAPLPGTVTADGDYGAGPLTPHATTPTKVSRPMQTEAICHSVITFNI